MPYPNEHSARLQSPDITHIRVRRTKGGKLYGKKVPTTIGIIWFITKKNGKEVPVAQSLRFPIKTWTVAKAKKWLKDNEIKYIKFEAAEKVKKAGKYVCECLKCKHVIKTDEHCKDIKCPKCSGEMRRKSRPGVGKAVKKNIQEIRVVLEKITELTEK